MVWICVCINNDHKHKQLYFFFFIKISMVFVYNLIGATLLLPCCSGWMAARGRHLCLASRWKPVLWRSTLSRYSRSCRLTQLGQTTLTSFSSTSQLEQVEIRHISISPSHRLWKKNMVHFTVLICLYRLQLHGRRKRIRSDLAAIHEWPVWSDNSILSTFSGVPGKGFLHHRNLLRRYNINIMDEI